MITGYNTLSRAVHVLWAFLFVIFLVAIGTQAGETHLCRIPRRSRVISEVRLKIIGRYFYLNTGMVEAPESTLQTFRQKEGQKK